MHRQVGDVATADITDLGVQALAAPSGNKADRLLVFADDGETALATVHGRGVEPLSSLVRRATLEDVFLHLTGRTLVD